MKNPPVLIKGDELFLNEIAEDHYETSRDLSKYLLMHYGSPEDVFESPHHPLAFAHGYPERISRILQSAALAKGVTVSRALDVGCSVGGVAHALSRWVDTLVCGVDASARSIDVATTLTQNEGGTFGVVQQGPYSRYVSVRVSGPESGPEVGFEVGDACDLHYEEQFDAVILSNVLDRVAHPGECLRQFEADDGPLRRGGLLLIACPWSWYPDYSRPEEWFGSARDEITSEDDLKTRMSGGFTMVHESDQPAVLRQNPREYDYFNAHVTVWEKL